MAKKNDYIVAIPSYDREEEIINKTLPMLKRQGVSSKRIDIFVADKEQEKKYESVISPNYYNKIIVGKKGLANQLQFIKKYYPQGKHIVRCDDDIESVFKKVSDKKTKEVDLNIFIPYAFGVCAKEGLSLWGINKVTNPFFMTDGYSTDLRFIQGGFNGFINSNNKSYDLKIKKNSTAEDIERTIRYYIADGGVVRFNEYAFKTKLFGDGGIQTELGGFDKRQKLIKQATSQLEKLYPNYGEVIPHKEQGVIFRLHRTPKG